MIRECIHGVRLIPALKMGNWLEILDCYLLVCFTGKPEKYIFFSTSVGIKSMKYELLSDR